MARSVDRTGLAPVGTVLRQVRRMRFTHHPVAVAPFTKAAAIGQASLPA